MLAISAAASEVPQEESDASARDKRGLIGAYPAVLPAALPVSYSSHYIHHTPAVAVAYHAPVAKYIAPIPAVKVIQPYPFAKVLAPALPYAKLAYPSPVLPYHGLGYGYAHGYGGHFY